MLTLSHPGRSRTRHSEAEKCIDPGGIVPTFSIVPNHQNVALHSGCDLPRKHRGGTCPFGQRHHSQWEETTPNRAKQS